MALIPEPRRLPVLLRLGVAASERVTGRRMVPARLLAWAPRQAVGAGVLEALVAHDVPSARILRLVRLTASLTVGCAFCIDLNGHERERQGVSDAELAALTALGSGAEVDLAAAFPAPRERCAVNYAHRVSLTPPDLPAAVTAELTRHFTERELVTLAATIAQVNSWARFNQALGVPPAGFTDACRVSNPDGTPPGPQEGCGRRLPRWVSLRLRFRTPPPPLGEPAVAVPDAASPAG